MSLTDLRVAARSLLQRPLLSVIAVLTLALGIGANATIFSLADGVAFRPLPARDPARLVALYATRHDAPPMGFSFPDYLDLRGAIAGIPELAAYHDQPLVLGRDADDPEPIWAHLVTETYFPLLGLHPAAGRFFGRDEAGDGGRGGAAVAVLSHDYFARRFGGDRAVLGTTVRLNGRPFTIVGVAPEGYTGTRSFTYAPDVFVPIAQYGVLFPDRAPIVGRRDWNNLYVIGRLAPGATVEATQTAASATARRLAAAWPNTAGRDDVVVLSNRTAINPYLGSPRRIAATALLMLFFVGLVLLVACANVANLILVRATGRRHELAVRASLGAGRWQLGRQLLLESLLLALAGGAAGLAIAAAAPRLLAALLPRMPHTLALTARLDARVAAFALGAALLSMLLAGALPARRAAATDPAAELRAGRSGVGVRRGSGVLRGLVVAQVAFSLVVLVAGGLFARSLRAANRFDLGFRTDGALVFGVDATLRPYAATDPDALPRRIAEAVAALPGVQAVSWSDDLPLDGSNDIDAVAPLGQGAVTGAQVLADVGSVGDGFFGVMGIPLRAGRAFVAGDRTSAVERVVVSEALARRLFPGRDAVGQRFDLAGAKPQPLEVVGVAGDVKEEWLGEPPRPYVYFDARRNGTAHPLFVVRVARAEQPQARAAVLAAVRARVRGIDPRLPVTDTGTLREHMDPAFRLPRDGAYVATSFALLALLLAGSGIFGVIAYGVAQRRRELAIRLAVGSSPLRLLATTMGGTLRLLGGGVALGLVGAAAASALLRGLLYGISPHDPLTFALGAAAVVAIGLLATLLPAVRVMRVDPSLTLRSEA